jgi:S-formylglutathione hydrolase
MLIRSVADSNPTECQWGQKAFKGYLASPEEGKAYDSTLLLSSWPKDQKLVLKIDYGSDDQFYKDGQLRPEAFEKALAEQGREGEVRVEKQEGYDHS